MCVCLGYIEYKVKIYEEVHLEEDPDFPCRKYSSPGQYDQCLEDEYLRQADPGPDGLHPPLDD